jgi:UDP-glucose 4-epimerase
MNCVVTGCAGFIGSHLTESLLRDGVSVIGVDCFTPSYERSHKRANLTQCGDFDHFRFVQVDLASANLTDIVRDADVVYHLAAEPGVRSSWGKHFNSYLRNNVLITQRLLETMRTLPGRRLVYASSSSVYGDAEVLPTGESAVPRPLSPYGVTKLSTEHLCRIYALTYGISSVGLRYFSVYGPRQRPDMAFYRFCHAALLGNSIEIYGDGTHTRDFTYISDAVAATRQAATAVGVEGSIYNIGGGSQIVLNEALATLAEIAGNGLDIRYLPPTSGDVTSTHADISRAKADLGYDPGGPFAQGLRCEFDWVAATLRA